MRVLVLGSGAREHALAWKISQAPNVEKVFLHPGNGGTEDLFPKLSIGILNPQNVLSAIDQEKIELVVIGSEIYLAQGYGDALRHKKIAVVGPNRYAAQLETSKLFAKQFMERGMVPTAKYSVATSPETLLTRTEKISFPVVLKLDGLAAGKGVVLPNSHEEIADFSRRIWEAGEFGPGPHTVLIEDFIAGTEITYIGLCDGQRFLPMASAMDYKRIGVGNTGPNTGGMGAISPSPLLTPALEKTIEEKVIQPILEQMAVEEMDYRGALYVGLMISSTGRPYVLEFNCRFGDPETQAILLRLESNFANLLVHTAAGTLRSAETPQWSLDSAVYIVGAAEGYPAQPRLGDPIRGLDTLAVDAHIFFAGVAKKDGQYLTAGGRVLGSGQLGQSFAIAREKAYQDLKAIRWDGMYFRDDIGD